jgi:transposase
MRLACMEDTREELKSAISKLGEMGRGKRYPKVLLEKLLSYTVARRRQGATLVVVGAELGMNWKTLARWVGERKARPRFERVEVVAAAPSLPVGVVVHGPRGVRIEGLDVSGVAELVRRLGE